MSEGGHPRRRRRLLFVVNVDWFFLSHRLPLALAAQAAGYDVLVAAADSGQAAAIRRHGLAFEELPFTRTGTRLLAELATFFRLIRLYLRTRPDIVHHVTIKPVLYGSLAARICGIRAVVNAITGFGYAFSRDSGGGILQRAVTLLYRIALKAPATRTIFQNPEDMQFFADQGLVEPGRAVLIRGSGVDCRVYAQSSEPEGRPVVMLPARMLWEKGVQEFVDAALALSSRGVDCRFVLVGSTDANPTTVPEAQLLEWSRSGPVEWWQYRADMAGALSEATIVALPTFYREGLPKALLEAAAVGRALIATDIPGCREIVRPGVNGILIPTRDSGALAAAVERLLDDPVLRRRYAANGRRLVEKEFAVEHVVQQTLDLYSQMLGAPEFTGNGRPVQ